MRGALICRGVRLSLVLAVMVAGAAACDSGASSSATAGSPGCRSMSQQLHDAIVDLGSCETDTDCSLIGGQLGQQTCDCAPSILDCGGLPIGNNAPGLSRARDLIRLMADAKCATDTTCDCAPNGPLRCSDHRCYASMQSCFP